MEHTIVLIPTGSTGNNLFRLAFGRYLQTQIENSNLVSNDFRNLYHAQERALENQSYLLGCNTVGIQGDVQLVGNSLSVNPNGEVVAELGGEEGVLLSKLDSGLVLHSRLTFPAMNEFMDSWI